MDEQRQRHGGGRRRRRKQKTTGRSAPSEPIVIAARRPNAPLPHRVRASAAAAAAAPPPDPQPAREEDEKARPEPVQRRSARIVQLVRSDDDAKEKERRRMLDRLMTSETRGAITRAAKDYVEAGHAFPEEQAVQLQLLEHFDEERAKSAVEVLDRLLDMEAPLKRPILEQRLRRLEEYADDPETRSLAGKLRQAIRS